MSYTDAITLRELHKWSCTATRKFGILASKSTSDPKYEEFKTHVKEGLDKLTSAVGDFNGKAASYTASEKDGLTILTKRVANLVGAFAKLYPFAPAASFPPALSAAPAVGGRRKK